MKQKTLKILIILLALILAAVLILTVVLMRQEKTPQETGPSTQGQTVGQASATENISDTAGVGDMLPLDTEGADISGNSAETTPVSIDPTSATDVPIEGLPGDTEEDPTPTAGDNTGNTAQPPAEDAPETPSQEAPEASQEPATEPADAPSEEPTEEAAEGTLPPNWLPIG